MASEKDYFHCFTSKIEDELGRFVIIKEKSPATKYHSAAIEYIIPAKIIMYNGKKEYTGQFEFIMQDGEITHRFFNRNVEVDDKLFKKEKAPLLLSPAPEGYQGKGVDVKR